MEQYMKVLKSYKRMPREMEDRIRENVKPIRFPDATFIQKEGTFCNHIYFIEKGVVRIYHGERTTQFKKENEFIISNLEDVYGYKAPGIEALEDITAWDFSPQMLEDTAEQFDLFHQHLNIMMMKDMKMITEINSLVSSADAASLLYDYLRRQSPDLLDRVAPAHIASFLGVSEKVFLHMKSSNIRTGIRGKHVRRT